VRVGLLDGFRRFVLDVIRFSAVRKQEIVVEETLERNMAGDIQGALQNAAGICDQKQKIDHYKLLLSSIMCNNNVEHAKAFIDHSKLSFANPTLGPDNCKECFLLQLDVQDEY